MEDNILQIVIVISVVAAIAFAVMAYMLVKSKGMSKKDKIDFIQRLFGEHPEQKSKSGKMRE